VPYVATLHDFGANETPALLGRLIRELRPAATLRARRRPGERSTVRFANVGPRAIAASQKGLWILTREFPVNPMTPKPRVRASLLRVDPSTGRIGARIGVGGYTRGILAAGGSIWIAAARPISWTKSHGVVMRLDAATGRVLAVIRTGTWAAGLAAGAGGVWTVNTAPFFKRGSLVRIDAATNRLDGRPTPLGPAPSGVAVGAGSVWVADAIDGTVRRIDPVHRRTIARIRVGRQPYELVFAAGSVWVTNADDGTVSRIDPRANRVNATIRVGPNPYGIAVGNRSLWVANLGNGTVSELELSSGRTARTIRIGGDPLDVAVAAGSVWVSENSDGIATRIK
jgi:YVTN family beta-propeller protein